MPGWCLVLLGEVEIADLKHTTGDESPPCSVGCRGSWRRGSTMPDPQQAGPAYSIAAVPEHFNYSPDSNTKRVSWGR